MAMYKVVLSNHAKQRLLERVGSLKGAEHEIAMGLITTLHLGAKPGPNLEVTVLLPDGFKALCVPTFDGKWLAKTVLDPEMVIGPKDGEPA